jgi:hypothetical protein
MQVFASSAKASGDAQELSRTKVRNIVRLWLVKLHDRHFCEVAMVALPISRTMRIYAMLAPLPRCSKRVRN